LATVNDQKTPIRQLSDDKRKRYFRENKRKNRLKNKKCARCGAQATTENVFTKELLCDRCEVIRLKETYKKKEEVQV